ncbi:hypothetical protein [Halococcus sp. IIIV-5B]|uniref:hypothetical protein n=1 Tax=Halococcus sp. IIIV-5B TaxID=2321230 RepID=UPI000E7072D6|nr:hypothetical protein [Halococcus sp. IIIV-5B]RJT00193.1 hypothetical protein D3261_15405 [Halococcus sp. IIIV-5B]
MDTRTRLRRALGNPVLFGRQANRLYHRRLGRRTYNTDGTAIFEEDWDSLLVLDACRYDLFATRSSLPGRLERRRSRGSATTEFLRANLDGRDLRDTVYVTANPQIHHNSDSIQVDFHDVIHVWRDGWNDDHDTVLPETVTEAAARAAHEYPNKRLLVHYLQPHYPFIDAGVAADTFRGSNPNIWNQLLTGAADLDPHEVWEMYAENLDRALPHVEELMDELGGKTVVTADHGNMVGERAFPLPIREWGHPRGIYTDELVAVPWLVYENGPRRKVTAEASTTATTDEDATDDDDVVAERLRDLGYAE